VLCWIAQLSFENDAVTLERLRYNFIGGMLPFGMGLVLARYEPRLVKDWTITKSPSLMIAWALNLFIVIAFSFTFSSSFGNWLWMPVLIVLGTIALVKLLPEGIMTYVVWLGTISAAIFVTHPLVRKIFVRPYLQDDLYAGLLLYVVATLLLSWLVKKIIDQIPSPKL
jgi:peptidoglycan/LPS O-acetylase OafA/YrhL